jgi:hypothetical protein
VEYVEYMGEMRNAYRILVVKLEWKTQHGKPMYILKYNIRMCHKEKTKRAVARQRLPETSATMKGLLEAVFSVGSLPRQYSEGCRGNLASCRQLQK